MAEILWVSALEFLPLKLRKRMKGMPLGLDISDRTKLHWYRRDGYAYWRSCICFVCQVIDKADSMLYPAIVHYPANNVTESCHKESFSIVWQSKCEDNNSPSSIITHSRRRCHQRFHQTNHARLHRLRHGFSSDEEHIKTILNTKGIHKDNENVDHFASYIPRHRITTGCSSIFVRFDQIEEIFRAMLQAGQTFSKFERVHQQLGGTFYLSVDEFKISTNLCRKFLEEQATERVNKWWKSKAKKASGRCGFIIEMSFHQGISRPRLFK